MVKGVVIPAVPFLPVEEREFTGLHDYQDAVGGYIEPVSISEPALTIYVNEDGKSRKMSFNERATALWWLLVPAARGRDLLVGDTIVMPDPDPDDATAAIQFLDQLQRGYDFHVEVQVAEAIGVWLEGPRIFRSWFEAATFALALEQRYEFIAAVRVTSV